MSKFTAPSSESGVITFFTGKFINKSTAMVRAWLAGCTMQELRDSAVGGEPIAVFLRHGDWDMLQAKWPSQEHRQHNQFLSRQLQQGFILQQGLMPHHLEHQVVVFKARSLAQVVGCLLCRRCSSARGLGAPGCSRTSSGGTTTMRGVEAWWMEQWTVLRWRPMLREKR